MLQERATVSETFSFTTLLFEEKVLVCLHLSVEVPSFIVKKRNFWHNMVYYRLTVQPDISDFCYTNMLSKSFKFRLAHFGAQNQL